MQTKFETEKDEEKKEILKRSIHWFEDGKLETKDKIDRFIKVWIALEVLVEGEGERVINKIKVKLTPLYPKVFDNQKNRETVGLLYDDGRAKIVHHGEIPDEFDKYLNMVESITFDLLRQELGLNPKYLAKKFFI